MPSIYIYIKYLLYLNYIFRWTLLLAECTNYTINPNLKHRKTANILLVHWFLFKKPKFAGKHWYVFDSPKRTALIKECSSLTGDLLLLILVEWYHRSWHDRKIRKDQSFDIFHIDTPNSPSVSQSLVHRTPPTQSPSSCPLLHIKCSSWLKHHFIFLLLFPKTCNRYPRSVFSELMFPTGAFPVWG